MRLNASLLYEQVKASGKPPSGDVVAELYGALDRERQRAIVYRMIEYIEAGHTNKVTEFPTFGPQGELFT